MGVGTAGNHREYTLMECMVPEASVWATALLQTGTLLTHSDNIYPSYVRGRYQSSFLSLKRAEPAVGLEPRTSGQDGHGSMTVSLTLCHCTNPGGYARVTDHAYSMCQSVPFNRALAGAMTECETRSH